MVDKTKQAPVPERRAEVKDQRQEVGKSTDRGQFVTGSATPDIKGGAAPKK